MRAGSLNTDYALLTVKEAAAYLKATPNTITIWCRAGQLPAIKIGRQWRISKKALDQMVTISVSETRLHLPPEETA
jgi:excisionase family DNA binding protein